MAVEAKVAAVLNTREIVFNRGATAGVKKDDIARVVRRRRIVDPDSKQPLGSINRTIVQTRIVEVQPKLSVGRTFETVPADLSSILATGTLRPAPPIEEIVTTESEASLGRIFVSIGSDVDIFTPSSSGEGTPPKRRTTK